MPIRGIPETLLDSRYVNVTGDESVAGIKTMTGALIITPTADSTSILQVNQADTTPVFNVDTTNAQTIFNGVVDKDAIVLKDGSTKKASLLWGTNTVTLDIFSEEPTNKISNGTFETDLTGWDIGNTEETDANGDWVLVPGNPDFGTGGAFYVMKYEAKYDSSGDGQGNTAVEASAEADTGLGLDYRDLTFDSAKVVSTANGAPIVHITQPQAITACTGDYHLITNAEWMTIARNAEAQTSNWADGVVGSTVAASGGMFRGNVGNLDSVGYNGTDPEYGTGRDTKAKLTLSNGTEIWDLSGNVWEFNSDTITQQNQPDVSGQSGFAWREFTALTSYGSLSYDLVRPAGTSYNADYGVGRIYHYSDSASATEYVFLRGGRWSNTAYAGAFALALNNTTSNQNGNVGFRCASDHVDLSHSTAIKYSGTSSMKIVNGSPIDTRIVQSANVGDTSTYTLIAYAYTDGSAVTSADLELWYDSAVLSTSYTSVGGGWYRLSGTLTGVASSKSYGVQIKAVKTVYVDNISVQAGIGTTQTFNVTNSGSGTVKTNFEDTVTISGGSDTQQLIIQAHSTQTVNISEIQLSDTTVTGGWDKVGTLFMKETTTPTATTNYGKVYTKSDNKLYFQDGAGTEKEIAFV